MANDTRIVLGKRGADYGCFISPPGKDVLTSVDGDLIFDSTAEGLIQVKATGTVLVPNSTDPNQQFAGIVIIHTGIPTHFDDGSSHTLTWSTLLDPSTSNVSPVFTAEDSLVTTNCPWLNLGLMDIKKSYELDMIPGYTLTGYLWSNIATNPPSQIVVFVNGSPNNEFNISWTLYSEKGNG
ncbi:MAG TPA: hypothetical protein EYN69_07545 [Flavobacteriales bacterium]|nr:hypothetical protein [Flavobacteriales bacterium]